MRRSLLALAMVVGLACATTGVDPEAAYRNTVRSYAKAYDNVIVFYASPVGQARPAAEKETVYKVFQCGDLAMRMYKEGSLSAGEAERQLDVGIDLAKIIGDRVFLGDFTMSEDFECPLLFR